MSDPEQGALRLGETPPGFRSGFVSIVGRPNVGKSTLLNQILRSKVAITSDRPQTTRSAVRGIMTTPQAQIVFVDTPGLHKPRTALGQRLNRLVRATLGEVDLVVFVVDAAEGVGGGDSFIAEELRRHGKPVVVAMNKIDIAGEAGAEQARSQQLDESWPVYAVSARTGAGVPDLVRVLTESVPEGPLYYPPDSISDQPEQVVIAELIREKVLDLTREEIPHSVAVVVDEIEHGGERRAVDVRVTIYVERSSQKGIVIGKGGSLLKEVGTKARPEIEAVLGEHVFLDLRVKVARDWQHREGMVERFGYGA